MELVQITRVEIIDGNGRMFVAYYDQAGVDLAVQDEGRTLKVFVNGKPQAPDYPVVRLS